MTYVKDWRRNTPVHKYKIAITELAEQDLEEIGDYIAFQLKNPQAATGMVRALQKEVNFLALYPERHELDDDSLLAELNVRRHYHQNYKIYYMVHEPTDSVVVLRILHMLVDSKAKIYKIFGI